eukprot:s1379_g12.t1
MVLTKSGVPLITFCASVTAWRFANTKVFGNWLASTGDTNTNGHSFHSAHIVEWNRGRERTFPRGFGYNKSVAGPSCLQRHFKVQVVTCRPQNLCDFKGQGFDPGTCMASKV